ncbi:hypothetical protein DPSP01_004031 [Paraphaeosphaeria sporulosa]|uniref:Uncharacterized protein n=1 Tax=Paraphaeosphaeria sporulosa TaxID=1460663 RepID=A0A177CVK8_9PLEO|nr:uncharacterized protein CC84DRAFT_1083880 [Paraphaeosphaeria sporulosa]OAG10900.1 hypothetical protein CC84DRAFT_1083880 [Paraphaeosphaeria sporulosa]
MAASNHNVPTPVPFPHPDATPPPTSATPTTPVAKRSRTSTSASTNSVTGRIRTASIKAMEASPPPGMWAATGSVTAKAPTLADIRGGSFSESGWQDGPQRMKAERKGSQGEGNTRAIQRPGSNLQGLVEVESIARPPISATRTTSSEKLRSHGGQSGVEPFPVVTEEEMNAYPQQEKGPSEDISQAPSSDTTKEDLQDGSRIREKGKSSSKDKHEAEPQHYANGYQPPPKLPWTTSTVIGLKAFWKWFLTIPGFLITLYGLNVVAWGGMLFLLLCNAAPAMCTPTCDDIQSPRRIWVEIDSQILNALFCVTGFGLAPWRFRDLFWLGYWRLGGATRKQVGMRRLAGIHRGWFRLPGSEDLPEHADATTVDPEDPAVPIPVAKIPDPPPTGVRAPPTQGWKMDFVVWMNVWNTFFQVVLCFYMYHYNRYDRPSWATGLFVALGCIVAGLGGIMMHIEGKAVKKVEGVPMPEGGYQVVPADAEAQPLQAQASR